MTRADNDAGWRRPAGESPEPGPPPAAPAARPTPAYSGPPPTNPPPAGWRPPVVHRPAPPRALPEQDHDRIDVEEQAGRTLTQGIGMVVAAVLVVLMLILCVRAF